MQTHSAIFVLCLKKSKVLLKKILKIIRKNNDVDGQCKQSLNVYCLRFIYIARMRKRCCFWMVSRGIQCAVHIEWRRRSREVSLLSSLSFGVNVPLIVNYFIALDSLDVNVERTMVSNLTLSGLFCSLGFAG